MPANSKPDLPRFRDDLEVLVQSAPGMPRRHLVRDPLTLRVHVFDERDYFLCRQLDGRTPLPEVQARFRSTFGLEVERQPLEAFVRQLQTLGLLQGSTLEEPERAWNGLRPFAFNADRLFRRLASALAWAYTRPAVCVYAAATGLSAILLFQRGPDIVHALANVFTSIARAGYSGQFSLGSLVQIALFVIFLPFVRELAKGTTCRHLGFAVPEMRYGWYLRVFPRVAVDLRGLVRMNSRQQTTVLASGIIVEWLLVCLGVLGAEWVYASGTIHEILNNLAIGATVRFLLNANPFGKLDGAFLLSVWTRTPDLRRRATAWFRSWIVRQPPTEPLTPRQARMFLVYGALADATTILIDLLLIWLLGYLLVGRLAGPGAVLFLTFVILKYERTLRRWATATRSLLTGQATADQQRRARTIGLALGGLGLCLCAIPYPFKVTGPLRVQPAVKHHVRAAVEAPIDAILVAEGSPVQKGQVMARLSEREIRHNLDKVRAALERESEQLRMLQNGARPEEIDQAEQQIRLAEVSLRHSSNALSRLQPLYRNQQVSDSEFDRAIRQRDLDLEQRELAVRELALVKAGTRPEQIEAKRAEVERVRAQFTHLEWQLEQTRIAAPIAGRVTSLFVQEKTGQHLKVGDVVAVVEDPRTALLRVGIPECYAALLKEGAPVQAKVRGFPNRTFAGTVRSISPIVVEQQEDRTRQASAEQDPTVLRSLDSPPVHVIPILVEVPNEDGVLKTDMTGYAKVRVRNTSVAYALVHPVIDFVRVQVWSWVP